MKIFIISLWVTVTFSINSLARENTEPMGSFDVIVAKHNPPIEYPIYINNEQSLPTIYPKHYEEADGVALRGLERLPATNLDN